jgi:DnaJ-class molecular chaperone
MSPTQPKTCPRCLGRGQIMVNGHTGRTVPCRACKGQVNPAGANGTHRPN